MLRLSPGFAIAVWVESLVRVTQTAEMSQPAQKELAVRMLQARACS